MVDLQVSLPYLALSWHKFMQVTLDEGADQDFLLSTDLIQHFSMSPAPNLSLSYILDEKVESDEMFALQLTPSSAVLNGPNVFFRNVLKGIIIDGDGNFHIVW